MNTITALIAKYNLTPIYNNEHSDEPLINDMAIAGDDIFIGEYTNKEFELISLFHEIGHKLISQEFIKEWNYNTLVIEIECWKLGLEEARKNGILFSDKAIEWGYTKAMSYVGHDEREYVGWDETHGSSLWINKGENE